MEKKYRLVTETGRILLGGETYNHNAAERWFDDFNGIYEDEETGSEERIYIEEVQNMEEYYITYNDYFGFCVVEKINGNGKIVFTGSIEDCNRKCIELNSLNQPKRSRSERQPRDGRRGSDDGRPERGNIMEKIVNWLISCGYGKNEAITEANKMIEANRWDGVEKC